MTVLSFDVTNRKPYAGGREFGATGAYEQLVERWRAIQLLERCN